MITLLLSAALAATYTIPTDGSLSSVLLQAQNGDVISIDVSYTGEAGPIPIPSRLETLTIRGINGRPSVPTLTVSAGEVTFENLRFDGNSTFVSGPMSLGITNAVVTIRGADFPRSTAIGIAASDAVLTVDGATFTGHTDTRAVALIRSQAAFNSVTFQDNTSGAIASELSVLDITGATFQRNSALMGGDILASIGGSLTIRGYSNGDPTTSTDARSTGQGGSVALLNTFASIDNTLFFQSTADLEGGAIYVEENVIAEPYGVPLALSNVIIQGSSATAGGAIFASGRVSTTMRDTYVLSTWANQPDTTLSTGGGVHQDGGWLTMDGGGFSSIYADQGGAINAVGDAVVQLFDVEFDGAVAENPGQINARNGGMIAMNTGTLRIKDSRFLNLDASLSGSALYLENVNTLVARTSFTDCHAEGLGTIHQTNGVLRIEDTTATNVAAGQSGWLDAAGGLTTLSDITLRDVSALDGAGVITISDSQGVEIRRMHVCASSGTTGGLFERGMISIIGNLTTAQILASTFTANTPGPGGVIARDGTMADEGPLKLDHLTLVDNAGLAIRASGQVNLENSLVVGHDIALSGPGLMTYNNLYWDNVELTADGATVEPDALIADPRFIRRTGTCDADLGLLPDSPALGVPSLGATGGPDADAIDRDQDGWPRDQDCDDFDPGVYPGAVDLPGDGLDADCDGLDGDIDGDGFVEPWDCDEGDGSTYPGAPEIPQDGRDQNCSGEDATSWVGGLGCTHAVGSSHVPAWLIAVGLFARRRR